MLTKPRTPKSNVTMSVADLLERLPAVKNDERVRVASEKLRELENQLREVRLAMSPGGGGANYCDANAPRPARFDRVADARGLLSGDISLDDMAGQNVTTQQQDLARQRAALETALCIQTETLRDVTQKVIQDFCVRHAGDIVPVIRRVIEGFEHLEAALQDLADLDAGLSRLGYSHHARPTGWRILDKEIAFLRGGPEFQSIRWWVQNRKKNLAFGGYENGK